MEKQELPVLWSLWSIKVVFVVATQSIGAWQFEWLHVQLKVLVSTLESTSAPISLSNIKDPVNPQSFKRRRRLGSAKKPI